MSYPDAGESDGQRMTAIGIKAAPPNCTRNSRSRPIGDIAKTAASAGCRSLCGRAVGSLPVGHAIHFHRFEFWEIKPKVLCDEHA
jgi:hypothetical protein